MTLATGPYLLQADRWPQAGQHVLAQYVEATIVVYQAYRPEIAGHAVAHQAFGGEFSFTRVSRIKPDFLWMKHRSGWATKPGQERVLAIRMSRIGFDEICDREVESSFRVGAFADSDAWKAALTASEIRPQWDPDHDPLGVPIELGLRGGTLRAFSERWIQEIEDLTEFVRRQHENLKRYGSQELAVPSERVYPASAAIGADTWEEHTR